MKNIMTSLERLDRQNNIGGLTGLVGLILVILGGIYKSLPILIVGICIEVIALIVLLTVAYELKRKIFKNKA